MRKPFFSQEEKGFPAFQRKAIIAKEKFKIFLWRRGDGF